jgi:hypothetical protein
MNIEEQNDEIIKELKILNSSIHKQNSKMHIINTGVIYGVGFFIGSAIIATIALGFLGPIAGKISWVKEYFEIGTSILKPN